MGYKRIKLDDSVCMCAKSDLQRQKAEWWLVEAGEEGGEVIIGVSVWGDEVNVGASYTLCESSLSH